MSIQDIKDLEEASNQKQAIKYCCFLDMTCRPDCTCFVTASGQHDFAVDAYGSMKPYNPHLTVYAHCNRKMLDK